MPDPDPADRWDELLSEVEGWRAEVLTTVRRVVHGGALGMVEEWKWAKPPNPRGVPVWSCQGGVCTGEVSTRASLDDPARLFTSSLEGKVRRAVDLTEVQVVDEDALADLVRAVLARNTRT